MRRTVATIAVIVTVLSGLTASPARATTVKVITLTAIASMSNGLGYPGAPPDMKIPCTEEMTVLPDCLTVKTGPKGEPIVNVKPHGNHASFDFSTIFCVKESVSTDPAKKTPGVAFCAITASGAVWGFCGLATGLGVMSITNLGPPPFNKSPATISTDIKFTDIAGIWYITGGGAPTWISGALSAQPTPDPGGTSCSFKTADSFQFTGQIYYKDIT